MPKLTRAEREMYGLIRYRAWRKEHFMGWGSVVFAYALPFGISMYLAYIDEAVGAWLLFALAIGSCFFAIIDPDLSYHERYGDELPHKPIKDPDAPPPARRLEV